MNSTFRARWLASSEVISKVLFTSPSETQGLLAGTMRYFRASDIFGRKFTLSALEPLGTYSYQTSSRSGRIPYADWAEKYFSAQSARSTSRITLSPSYTRQFSSSIDLLAWPVQRNGKVVVENFRKKYSTKPRISQALTWGLGTNILPSIFSADLSKVYLKFL